MNIAVASAPGVLPSAYAQADFSQETWWLSVIKAILLVVYLILSVIMALWVERRGLGRMQTRPGPNVVGPLGLFQAFADAVKLMVKEAISTTRSEKFLYFLAPTISAFAAFSIYAVIPMGPNVSVFGHSTPLQLADPPVGALYILAVSSVGLYGIVLGGWSSRSTLSMYGTERATAQVISYELAMGTSLVSVFLMSGSMSTSQIVSAQGQWWWMFALLPSAIVYFISALGECNRLPFDLTEAEGEIVAGHMTEYSGMKFGWFYLSEYINMLNVSAVATTMFLGGWHAFWPFSHIPVINGSWWGLFWFLLKVWIVMFLIIWVRGTLIRVRYDQFMALGWKILLPVSLGWLVIVAVMQGLRNWVATSLPVMLGVIVGVFIVAVVAVSLADRRSERREVAARQARERVAAKPFDAFAGGFPVPPLPGQKLPPSPRSGRTPVGVTTSTSQPDAPGAPKEGSDE